MFEEIITIGEPLWTFKGKQGSPSIGIHPKKINPEKTLVVEVLFKKENGQKLYNGKFIMEGLSSLDKVAYVRFASVYKNFKEAKDFEQFIGNIDDDKS